MHFLSTTKENLLENQRLIPSEEHPMKFGPDVLVIDVVEAGRRLGISRSAAYQAVHAGQIPSVRFGRLIKVPLAALQRMLDQAGSESAGVRDSDVCTDRGPLT
jgi:excisionase family DNA binding protein